VKCHHLFHHRFLSISPPSDCTFDRRDAEAIGLLTLAWTAQWLVKRYYRRASFPSSPPGAPKSRPIGPSMSSAGSPICENSMPTIAGLRTAASPSAATALAASDDRQKKPLRTTRRGDGHSAHNEKRSLLTRCERTDGSPRLLSEDVQAANQERYPAENIANKRAVSTHRSLRRRRALRYSPDLSR
jgi:hypothetical protein